MAQTLTIESLSAILGREVEDVILTVAKSAVLGLTPEVIADTLGVERADLEDLMETQDYKDVRLLVGAEQAKERVERDYGWDGIESIAVRKLGRRAELENDTDTLLRIAAVANRATRRTAPPKEHLLDPSQAGARVPLTLTRRFTEKLNSDGQVVERIQQQQISVLNGSAVNPSFKEVNSLLQGVAPGGPVQSLDPEIPAENPQREQHTQARTPTRTPPTEEDFSLESLRKMAREMR